MIKKIIARQFNYKSEFMILSSIDFFSVSKSCKYICNVKFFSMMIHCCCNYFLKKSIHFKMTQKHFSLSCSSSGAYSGEAWFADFFAHVARKQTLGQSRIQGSPAWGPPSFNFITIQSAVLSRRAARTGPGKLTLSGPAIFR